MGWAGRFFPLAQGPKKGYTLPKPLAGPPPSFLPAVPAGRGPARHLAVRRPAPAPPDCGAIRSAPGRPEEHLNDVIRRLVPYLRAALVRPRVQRRASLAVIMAGCVIALVGALPAVAVSFGATDKVDPIAAQNMGLLADQQLPESEQPSLSNSLRMPVTPPGVAPPAHAPGQPPRPAPPKALRLAGLTEAPPQATDIPEFPSLDDLEVEARLERLSKLPPSLGLDIVRTGLTQKGRRYRWGGTAPNTGFDCSGFTQWTFQQHGINLPRTAKEQFGTGISISRHELRAGDLVFYKINRRGRWHVGIYMDDGTFVHSPRRGRNISEANMGDSYWARRYMGARRYAR